MTDIDLRQLPQLSIIALLARHARRVRAWCDIPATDSDRGRLMTTVDQAISRARQVAAGGKVETGEVHRVAGEALNAADAASEDERAAAAARTAAYAAYAAVSVGGNPSAVLEHAGRCFQVGDLPGTLSDFQKLLKARTKPFPDQGNPVDTSDEGPLGPLGLTEQEASG